MSEIATQRAVVIGGASGIGWAVAQGLAAGGRQVTVADRDADGAAQRAAELGAPRDAAGVDVTDEASVAALFERTGPVDIVVNTAGFGGFVHTPRTELVTLADGVLEDYIDNTPLGRVGVPEDVAEAHVDRMASA